MQRASLLSLFLVACVGDTVIPSGSDAGAEAATQDSSTNDSAANDGAPIDGSKTDAADATPPDFCQGAAAVGATFCADFQNVAGVGVGWDSVTAASGATVDLDPMGASSTKSALVKLGGTNTSQGTLRRLISAGSLKSKVKVEYDGYWIFPAWASTSYNGYVTFLLKTASQGNTTQYYVDIEREPTQWVITSQSGQSVPITSITPNVWHHVEVTYDASGQSGVFTVVVDGVTTGTATRPKGTPPNAAPGTFDQIFLNAGAENLGSTITTTSFYMDNIVVRFP